MSFRNTVIVMTSNLGARSIADSKPLGFAQENSEDDMRSRVTAELKQAFRPELLNRIDEKIIFHRLQPEDIGKITHLMLSSTRERASKLGVELTFTARAVDELSRLGYDPSYGARPLRRVIQAHIEDALADAFLTGTIRSGDTVTVDTDENSKIIIKTPEKL